MCNMLGLGDMNADQLASKLEETLPVIRSVSEQFKDPVSQHVSPITMHYTLQIYMHRVFFPSRKLNRAYSDHDVEGSSAQA